MLRKILFILMLVPNLAHAQEELIFSQYMNNIVFINPGYAGVRNALTTNFAVKKQWMNIDKAPTTAGLAVHSPINKTMASIGGSARFNQTGPIQFVNVKGLYSYLLRVNNSTFFSVGMSIGAGSYSIKTNGLRKINENDPEFAYDLSNAIKPNFGVGLFLYKPSGYITISCPEIWPSRFEHNETQTNENKISPSIFSGIGYGFPVSEEISIKPSLLHRYRLDGNTSIDLNMQVIYQDLLWIGVAYRLKERVSSLLHYQINKQIGVCYSYDIPLSSYFGNPGGHEISVIFDYHELYRNTRKRRFYKKRKQPEPPGIQSIRYF